MTLATTMFPTAIDPYTTMGSIGQVYESLFTCDWTLDRNVFNFQTAWTPDEYWVGCLAENWEWTDPTTLTIQLRKGIHWQNKPPVNGREFTAKDVQFHYDRMLGTGSGFTKPNPMQANFSTAIESVKATGKYTVVAKFKNPWPVKNFWSMLDINSQLFEAPEYVALGQEGRNDWKNVVGTGPYMLSDFVQGTSLTLSKNTEYWGYDERHPQNQLPYIDTVKILSIGDQSTQMAALRTGKIDMLNNVNWIQADSLIKTNPELQKNTMLSGANVVYFNASKGPFIDIRVRQAAEMSLNRESLANDYYKGNADTTPFGVIFPVYKDYAYLYKDWPQSLKDIYSYNPVKAKQLLADAGYPNGFTTSILAPNDQDLELLQIIQSSFEDIGIKANIRLETGPTVNSILQAKKQEQMDYGVGGTTHPWIMLENIASWGQNRASHHDTNFDAIVKNFMAAKDLTEAKKYSIEADKYTIEQCWALRPAMLKVYNFWQPYLKGYSGEILQSPTTAPSQWWWARFWIDQTQ